MDSVSRLEHDSEPARDDDVPAAQEVPPSPASLPRTTEHDDVPAGQEHHYEDRQVSQSPASRPTLSTHGDVPPSQERQVSQSPASRPTLSTHDGAPAAQEDPHVALTVEDRDRVALIRELAIVRAAVMADAEQYISDPVELSAYMGPLADAANRLMDDLTFLNDEVADKTHNCLSPLLLTPTSQDEKKFKLWQFLQFVVSVNKTCNYLQDPSGLFFVNGSEASMGWVHKQYPAVANARVSWDIDDSIRRFLSSSGATVTTIVD